jgi:carboxyl-terminal processing protease
MSYLKTKTFILATPVVLLGFFFIASCATGQKATPPVAIDVPVGTNTLQLTPGPNDPRIAYVTARFLESYHYTQRPMDTDLSEKFFDGYVDSLDPRHEDFLQSDLAEFSIYRTNLDKLTTGGQGTADLTPAFEIYRRYLQRLQQHDDYVLALLKEGHFKFNTDDRIAVDRRHEPYPKDMAEAEHLWEQRLKFEYLQDKLSREISTTNSSELTKLTKTDYLEITTNLVKHYQANLHIYTNWDSTDILQSYLNGLTHAYDPHSDYFNPEHAQDFSINMNLSLFGIGAQLMENDGYCTISKLVVGGPADKSKKLKEKDRIVAVAQGNGPPVSVVDMELGKVVQLIRGTKGTVVRLTISPEEDRAARKVISLVRDEIKLEDQQAKAKLIEIPDGKGVTNRIGVIDLPSFYAPVGDSNGHATPRYTSIDVAKLVTKLEAEKVNGIILDLRNNPGGSLEEAVKLTGLFIKDGPVVQARSPEGPINVDSDTDPSILYSGPLVVMINRFSASASEIAAAALQDYDRALIVGDSSSFGKGTVQSLNQLRPFVWPATPTATNDPGEVKVTIRKFYRINGSTTQFKGVMSDIILPDVLDHRTDIESEATLDNPLPYDTIPSASYTKFNMVQQYVPDLGKLSAARVATNQEFMYIQQDINELAKLQADKSITLNEREAITERQTNDARQKQRDDERAGRPPVNLTVYDISLADADLTGLPAPDYYPGMLETNETTSVTTNRQVIVRYDYDPSYLSLFGTNANWTSNPANSFYSFLTTNALPKDSTNEGSFETKIITAKKQPDLDPMLLETGNILQDYISLLSQSGTVSKN